jgi:hypothetical protein
MRGKRCALIIAAVSSMTIGSTAYGGEATLKVVDAWVPVTDKVGADVPLLLTERHTIDRGEGAPAMRMIRSIPIAGGGTTVLKADGYHIMLLQTRQPLAAGEGFKCSIDFQKAGTIETEVNVRTFP